MKKGNIKWLHLKVALLLFWICPQLSASDETWIVPEQMTFCGIELTLTPGARAEIKKTVDKLTNRADYHQELKRRISIFMPWVEDALQRCGVPEDLKYLVIQESAFVGDAVSSSNAVGFWQFKDFTAREMGLTINENLDERKHLYKSTIAAAKYFYQNNRYFDNYLYAVIAYYAGGGGSMAYINPTSFGAKKMTIEADFHWYPLKALAHKIVFEDYIRSAATPQVWLEAKYVSPGKSLPEICTEFQIHPDSFRKYNLWMMKPQLPATGKSQVAFIPRIPEASLTGTPIHNGKLPELIPSYAGPEIPLPQTIPSKPLTGDGKPFHLSYLLWDDDFRSEYIYLEKPLSAKQLAANAGIELTELKEWNPGIPSNGLVQAEKGYRKTDPKTSPIWIVQEGDSWELIAALTEIPEATIKKLNRVKKIQSSKPEQGRKIFLQEKAPKTITILQSPTKDKNKSKMNEFYALNSEKLYTLPEESSRMPIVCQPEGKGIVCKVSMPDVIKPFPVIRSVWLTHEVKRGEEIWALAKKYDTRGDLIRKLNQLSHDRIKPGMKLKLFITETL